MPPSGLTVGRSYELAAIAELSRAVVAHRRGASVVIEGPPGIGKTHVARAALAAAAPSLSRVLELGCRPLDAERPLRAVRAVPELASATTVDAALGLLDGLSDRPLALLVDDIQWADPMTAAVVHAVVEELADRPILVVATARTGSRPRHVGIALEAISERLALDQLSDADAAVLAAAVDAGADLDWIRRGGGLPLFVIQLASHKRADAVSVPSTLQAFVGERLREVGGEAARVLEVIALADGITSGDLAEVVGSPVASVRSTTDDLLAQGLVRREGGRVGIAYDVVRDAVLERIDASDRRAFHRSIAAVLARRGAPLTERATHLAEGAERGDVVAVEQLLAAADEVAGVQPRVATALLRRAAEVAGDGPLRTRVESRRIGLHAWQGRLDAALATADSALEAVGDSPVRAEERAELLRAKAHAIVVNGASGGGDRLVVRVVEEALALEGVSGRLRLDLLTLLAPFVSYSPRMAEVAHEIEQLGGEAADMRAAIGALVASVPSLRDGRSAWSSPVDGYAEAVRAARAAHAADGRSPHTARYLAWMLIELGTALGTDERTDDAVAALEEARRTAYEVGAPTLAVLAAARMADAQLWGGAVQDAVASNAAARAQAVEVGVPAPVDVVITDAMLRWTLDGDHRQWLDEHASEIEALGPSWRQRELALALDAAGEHARAAELFAAEWEHSAVTGDVWPHRQLAVAAVRSFIAAGRREEAQEVAESVVERASRAQHVPSLVTVQKHTAALIDGAPGAFDDALEVARRHPIVWILGPLLEHAALAHERTSRAATAVELLDEATDVYVTNGCTGRAARCEAQLARLRPAGPARRIARASHGWDALTPAELRVVELAAQGLSNPQIADELFVSRHTVVSHLKSAYGKLGLRSRVELAVAFAARRP